MSNAQRLAGENMLVFALGLGLLPILGVAPTVARFRRIWPVGYLAGLAAVGIVAATLAVLSVPFPPVALVVGAAITVALGARRLNRGPRATPPAVARIDRVVTAVLAPLLTLSLAWASWAYATQPLREWDGWAIWGLKAQAIAALGSSSHAVLASNAYDFSHLEYPLLLPALEALGIRSAGGFESRLVVLQCVLVGVAGLLAIWGLLRDRVRPAVVWPFLAAIATAPAVFVQLASGYADMPMAFFLACGLLAGGRWLLEPDRSWLVLASLLFAAAAVSKNEGVLFVAAAYVGLIVAARGRRMPVLLSAAAVVCTLIPSRVFLVVHHFSTSDFHFSKSFDPSWVGSRIDRLPTALSALMRHSVDVHRYGLLLPLGVTALAVCFASRARSLAIFGAVFALLSIAGLLWIYVISWIPLDLYLAQTEGRITAGVILGCAALAPLLLTEACAPSPVQPDALSRVPSRGRQTEAGAAADA